MKEPGTFRLISDAEGSIYDAYILKLPENEFPEEVTMAFAGKEILVPFARLTIPPEIAERFPDSDFLINFTSTWFVPEVAQKLRRAWKYPGLLTVTKAADLLRKAWLILK
jgi:hypothetical protein